MLKLHVTPVEHDQILAARDKAERTIDGRFNESAWCAGLQETIGEDAMEQIAQHGGAIMVVHHDGQPILTRLT